MADDCLPQVHAFRMRVAVLGPDGVPLPGAENLYTTNALTTLTLGTEVADATEIEERNGGDDICVAYQGDPSLKWGTVGIELCTPDPYLEAILSGGKTIDLGAGIPAGFAYPAIGPLRSNGFSIEVWARRINAGDVDPDYPYAWWALPKIKRSKLGERELGNSAQKPKYEALAYENTNWYDGPLNDWPGSSDRFAQWVPTASVPDAVCGPTALVAS